VAGDGLAGPAQAEGHTTGSTPVVAGDGLAGPAQAEGHTTGSVPVVAGDGRAGLAGSGQAEGHTTGSTPVVAGDGLAGSGQVERYTTGSVPVVAGDGLAGSGQAERHTTGSIPVIRDPEPGPSYVPGQDGTASVTRDPLPSALTTVMPVHAVPVLVPGPPPTAPGELEQEQTREPFGSWRQQRQAARPQWAQSKRTIRHFNVWTVFKVSLAFYFMLLVAVVVASVMLWYVANAFGSIATIEKSVRTLFDLSKFTIRPGEVLKYTAIGGGILAFCGTFANVLAAFMYNLISDLVGGIRFDVIDEGR
jgi:Transmembrane domain of unknown function (DUF3566)